ncbi:MAG: BatD family protein [Pirellulales bacterium]|nr:BatD family protein [Pirellulales bacterium]
MNALGKLAIACVAVLTAAPLAAVEPDSQDAVLMEITADPPAVYPTERFTVTLSVLVRPLPGELAGRNPVSIQQTPPSLQIPWLADAQLPEGLTPVESDRAWLSQLRDLRGEGFGINNVSDSSVFSIFEQRALAFQPAPRRAIRKNAAGESVDYWVYEFRRAYTADRAGRYTFGPASLKGTFATDLSASGRLSGDQVYAIAPRLDVDVKQVPEAGRPASYLGAIGRFDWSAELRPATCRVGDPITLTLTLRGRGSLDATTPPDLAEMPTVAVNFKTYEGTREVKGNTCQFTYTLRPLNENITEFPPIAGSYFDVATGRYVTLETKPIPIDVKKADPLADAQIIGPAGGNRTSGELKVQSEGISANITDPAQLRDQSVHVEAWLAGAAGLAGLYGMIAAVTWYVRRRWSDAALTRRRAATGRARRRLHDAVALLHARDSRRGAEGVRGALVGLVADVADLPEAGMTSADACQRLQGLGIEQPLVDRLARALEACDATRYAAGGAEMNGLADEAGSLLDGVVRSLKKQRCLR